MSLTSQIGVKLFAEKRFTVAISGMCLANALVRADCDKETPQ